MKKLSVLKGWLWFKHNMHYILFSVIVLYMIFVIIISVLQGIDRIVTQHEIDETYKIHQ